MARRTGRIPRIPKSTKQFVRGAGRGAKRRIKHRATGEAIATGAEIVIDAGDTFGIWRDIGELINMMLFWGVLIALISANTFSPLHNILRLWDSFLNNLDSVAEGIYQSHGKEPPKNSSYQFDGNIINDLSNAIAGQESGHSYTAFNDDGHPTPGIGAMGKYQFLPSTAAMFVDYQGRDEFLNNPEKQEQAFAGYINYLIGLTDGLQGCELARAIASGWYSGDPSLRNSTRPQWNNGRQYPSIKAYSDSVARKTHCEQW